MNTIIVTGATGFIGKSFLQYLEDKDIKIIAVARDISRIIDSPKIIRKIELENDDLLQLLDILLPIEYDAIYHLSWNGSSGKKRNSFETQFENVNSTLMVSKVAKGLNVNKFICLGTFFEFNLEYGYTNYNEIENYPYISAKLYLKYNLVNYFKDSKVKFHYLILPSIYGDNDSTNNIINRFIASLKAQSDFNFSSGKQIYDFLHIHDLSRALYLSLVKKLEKKMYYVGSGTPKQLIDFLKSIEKLSGLNQILKIDRHQTVNWFKDDSLLSNDNFYKSTGFRSKKKFKDSITKILHDKGMI